MSRTRAHQIPRDPRRPFPAAVGSRASRRGVKLTLRPFLCAEYVRLSSAGQHKARALAARFDAYAKAHPDAMSLVVSL